MILQKNNNELAGIYMIYKNTCLCENEHTFGVSHLLEHMICNSYYNKMNKYSCLALNTNAFTTTEYVCFYINGLHGILKEEGKEFFDLVYNYKPSYQDFVKEIPIVCQEYEDMHSNPIMNLFSNLYSKRFGRIYPIGTRKCLEKIEFDEIEEFYNIYFKLSEVIIVNREEKNYGISPKSLISFSPQKYNNYFEQFESCSINEASEDMVYINKKVLPDDRPYMLSFICKMLSDGLESPLYKYIREEKGLVYGITCDDVQFKNTGQLFAIATSSHRKNKSAIHDSIKYVLENPDIFLTQERFHNMLENTKIRETIRSQNKENFDFLSIEYINDHNSSLSKNINKINYNEMLDYYKQYIMPTDNYDFLLHSEVNGEKNENY